MKDTQRYKTTNHLTLHVLKQGLVVFSRTTEVQAVCNLYAALCLGKRALGWLPRLEGHQPCRATRSFSLSRAKGNLTCCSHLIHLPSAQYETCRSAPREFIRKLSTLPSPPAHRCQMRCKGEDSLKVLIMFFQLAVAAAVKGKN